MLSRWFAFLLQLSIATMLTTRESQVYQAASDSEFSEDLSFVDIITEATLSTDGYPEVTSVDGLDSENNENKLSLNNNWLPWKSLE